MEVYADSKGLPTVGLGHLVLPEDKLKLGDAVTLEKARKWVKQDIAIAEKAVNDKVKVPLHQYEYDALVSIVFNAGRSDPATSLAKLVNKGDYDKLPKKLALFWTADGTSNVGRRQSESKLFESGVYDASH